MANGNGNNTWVIKTLIGFLFTILFFGVTTLASNMVTNDKANRSRDTILREDLNSHAVQAQKAFNSYALEQQRSNQALMVSLKGMAKDIEYIKRGS